MDLAVTPEAAGDASDIPRAAKNRPSDLCCSGASRDLSRIVVKKAAKFRPALCNLCSTRICRAFAFLQPISDFPKDLCSPFPDYNLQGHSAPAAQQVLRASGSVPEVSVRTNEEVQRYSRAHATINTKYVSNAADTL